MVRKSKILLVYIAAVAGFAIAEGPSRPGAMTPNPWATGQRGPRRQGPER